MTPTPAFKWNHRGRAGIAQATMWYNFTGNLLVAAQFSCPKLWPTIIIHLTLWHQPSIYMSSHGIHLNQDWQPTWNSSIPGPHRDPNVVITWYSFKLTSFLWTFLNVASSERLNIWTCLHFPLRLHALHLTSRWFIPFKLKTSFWAASTSCPIDSRVLLWTYLDWEFP